MIFGRAERGNRGSLGISEGFHSSVGFEFKKAQAVTLLVAENGGTTYRTCDILAAWAVLSEPARAGALRVMSVPCPTNAGS